MAGKVRERRLTVVDGFLTSRDFRSSFTKDDKAAGKRLDRRRNYCIIRGEVCVAADWTRQCSGCDGSGCHECGHTGKRRESMWVPLWAEESSE